MEDQARNPRDDKNDKHSGKSARQDIGVELGMKVGLGDRPEYQCRYCQVVDQSIGRAKKLRGHKTFFFGGPPKYDKDKYGDYGCCYLHLLSLYPKINQLTQLFNPDVPPLGF